MEKKILLAVDGSTCSVQAVEYIATLFSGRPEIKIHIVHCTSSSGSILPESEDPANRLMPTSHRFDKHQATCLRYLKKAEDKLIALGVSAEQLTSSTVHCANIAISLNFFLRKNTWSIVLSWLGGAWESSLRCSWGRCRRNSSKNVAPPPLDH